MRYVRKKPDGSWEYSDEAPTDPNEPVITEDDVKGLMANPSFRWGESYAMKALGRGAERAAAPGPEERMGAPMMLPGGMQEFMDPQGMTETYGPEGRLISEGMPQHYSNKYSPRDQRRVEKLYQERSEIAMDPEIDETTRQSALEQVDMQLSSVPQLSPEMQQPTAQQVFDQSLVKTPDGQVGTVNPRSGQFNPITPSTDDTKQEQKLRDLTMKIFMSQDDEVKNIGKAETQARRIILGKQTGDIPEAFNLVWDNMLSELEDGHVGRATKKAMVEQMKKFRDLAMQTGVPAHVAQSDFLMRWKKAADKASVWRDDVVPPFPKEYEKYLKESPETVGAEGGGAGAMAFGEPESFAAVNGQEQVLPEGPVAKMGVGKGAALQDMSHLMKGGSVKVKNKQGQVGLIPRSQLKDALAEGYIEVK